MPPLGYIFKTCGSVAGATAGDDNWANRRTWKNNEIAFGSSFLPP